MARDSDNIAREAGLDVLNLVPYDPRWPDLYAAEALRLKEVEAVCETMHIGSTALPGIDAKPIVDIAVRVRQRPDDPTLRTALESIGYICHGEYGLPGRYFFTKGTPARFHLHVVDDATAYWADWRDFRDYLLTHADWRTRYQEEKLRIAEAVNWDRASYTKGKTAFVLHVLKLARGE